MISQLASSKQIILKDEVKEDMQLNVYSVIFIMNIIGLSNHILFLAEHYQNFTIILSLGIGLHLILSIISVHFQRIMERQRLDSNYIILNLDKQTLNDYKKMILLIIFQSTLASFIYTNCLLLKEADIIITSCHTLIEIMYQTIILNKLVITAVNLGLLNSTILPFVFRVITGIVLIADFNYQWSLVRTILSLSIIVLSVLYLVYTQNNQESIEKDNGYFENQKRTIEKETSILENANTNFGIKSIITNDAKELERRFSGRKSIIVQNPPQTIHVIQQFIDHLQTGIVIFNSSGNIVMSNWASENIFSTTNQEEIQDQIWNLMRIFLIDEKTHNILDKELFPATQNYLKKQQRTLIRKLKENNQMDFKSFSQSQNVDGPSPLSQSQDNKLSPFGNNNNNNNILNANNKNFSANYSNYMNGSSYSNKGQSPINANAPQKEEQNDFSDFFSQQLISKQAIAVSSQLSFQDNSKVFNLSFKEFIKIVLDSKEKLKGNQIQILRYHCAIEGYQIKVEVFQFQGESEILMILEDVQTRDQYFRNKFTYQVMKRLFQSFSHEFGTSLNCIMVLAQTANSNKQIQQNIQRNFFNPILKSTQILDSIVRDIRDYNHFLGNTYSLLYQEINLLEIIQENVDLFRSQIEQKGITIGIEVEDNVPVIICTDKNRVSQVLLNLLSNAQKFTFQGEINLQISQQQDFEVGEDEPKSSVRLLIQDSGVGMNDKQSDLLKNFLNGSIDEHGISTNSSGFGMGLYISNVTARQLSVSQDKGIQFVSEKNQGSQFWFDIAVVDMELRISNQSKLSNLRSQQFGNYIMLTKTEVYESNIASSMLGRESSTNNFRDRGKVQQQEITTIAAFNEQFLERKGDHKFSNIFNSPNFTIKRSQSLQNAFIKNQKLNHSTFAGIAGQNVEKVTSQFANIGVIDDTCVLGSPVSEIHQPRMFSHQYYKEKDEALQKQNTINIDWSIPKIAINQEVVITNNNNNDIEFVQQQSQYLLDRATQVNKDCLCNQILVVDDEPFNIQALEMLLQSFNLKCDRAYNGQESIERIQQKHNECTCTSKNYQIILMDINMAVMNGFEATKEIRRRIAQNIFGSTTIIACTAYVDLKTKQACFDSGMDFYITKPVETLALLQVLEKFSIEFPNSFE